MKVLNLRCAHDHVFEGWFASEADYLAQGERGLVACPLCSDTTIQRLPSAPRLNVSKQRGAVTNAAGSPMPSPSEAHQSKWLRAVRHMIANTEDVGERFPEEARRIHYGEADARAIRGRASSADAEALRDEGIEVVSVPVPEPLKGSLQ